jgi:hypothetical protein
MEKLKSYCKLIFDYIKKIGKKCVAYVQKGISYIRDLISMG